MVTSAHFPRRSTDWCEHAAPKLRVLFPNASICFTRMNEEGFAEVCVPEGDSLAYPARLIAAAVAAVKRIGGWEESDAIQIRLAPSGEEITLSPRPVRDEWVVPYTRRRTTSCGAASEAITSSSSKPPHNSGLN